MRSLLVWFRSPRLAALTVLRLRQIIPGSVVFLASSQATGAEGPVAVACGRIPVAERVIVGRLLGGLDVVVMWDTWTAGQPASSDSPAGR
jgi:hypothetical protein